MKLSIVLMAALFGFSSAGVLFSDDFEDGNADGWTEMSTGPTYFVGSGWYHMVHSGPDHVTAGAYTGDAGGSMSVADYSLLMEIYPREGEGGPVVRYDPATGSGYWLVMNPEGDGVALVKTSTSTSPVILEMVSMSLEYLDNYWMRIEVTGSSIGGKVWQGGVGDEPEDWLITAEDSSLSDPGSIALYCHGGNEGGTASLHIEFDDIEVTDDLSLPLEASTWGGLKAIF